MYLLCIGSRAKAREDEQKVEEKAAREGGVYRQSERGKLVPRFRQDNTEAARKKFEQSKRVSFCFLESILGRDRRLATFKS